MKEREHAALHDPPAKPGPGAVAEDAGSKHPAHHGDHAHIAADFRKRSQIQAVTLRNLDKQGFDGLDSAAKSRQAWPLRFTPAVGVTLIVVGLALQSPWWLAGMALVALSGVLLPGGMLIDTLYNIGVRHLFRAPPLPPTPKPRQFSYLISTALLSASAVLFFVGLPVLGSVAGGLVAIAGAVLATTHWCLGSFCYRLIFRVRIEKIHDDRTHGEGASYPG